MHRILVEAAVDTIGDALAAPREGADRIELCGPLHDGGTTPSAGLIRRCVATLSIPVHVLVRPRGGDFVYGADELAVMLEDIASAKALGAHGVVTGVLTTGAAVDIAAMRRLVDAAAPLAVGFHRAFDSVADQFTAVEQLTSLGVRHILTSGAAVTARDGAERLRALVARAGEHVEVIAGGSVTAETVCELVERTGVRAVHGRGFRGLAARLRGAV